MFQEFWRDANLNCDSMLVMRVVTHCMEISGLFPGLGMKNNLGSISAWTQ